MPERSQLRRTAGWRLPPHTRVVARPGRYGNRHRVIYQRDSGGWHLEHVISGSQIGTWPSRTSASRTSVSMFFAELRAGMLSFDLAELRSELVGWNVACWCPLLDEDGSRFPCHGDLLLELANPGLELR